MLEPIFEADFKSCSYGFRPGRQAQDAIAEMHYLASRSYEWVVEGDIKACFDEISHAAVLSRMRERIADRRIMDLVKAFLKSGILGEDGELRDSDTGAPQGGIVSPLISNIALSLLDEHFVEAWEAMGDSHERAKRRCRGMASYRLIRYADDWLLLVAGDREHAEALKAEAAQVLQKMGLRLSEEKTKVIHIDQGFDFLGMRIQRHQKRGCTKCYVYTYPSRRALDTVKAKVREITNRKYTSQTLTVLLHRLNRVLRGWTNYHRHGAAAKTFSYIGAFTWHRVVSWLRNKHPRVGWQELCRRFLPGGWPTQGEVRLFNPAGVAINRYRYRGAAIPSPWRARHDGPQQLSGMDLGRAGCGESRTSGSGGRARETYGPQGPQRALARPQSECTMVWPAGRLRQMAICRASTTSSVRIWSAIDQPTTRRLQESSTTAKYTLPSWVGCSVTSLTHSWSCPVALKSRLTRSSAGASAGLRRVQPLRRRVKIPWMPAAAISRAMRLRPTRRPSPRTSSACTRGAP
ncbi:MAG TPA: reverse transcriptase domain-containing protein [Actinomycetota bacterium]|nr:reverse transcriptase domain-containing protein [Actinomycetota bacterium]